MRKFVLSLVVLAMCAAGANAALTMFDDFESYDLGTIDMAGEIVELGFPIEVWNAQRNSDRRGDHGWSNVVVEDGDQCLQMINRDAGGELDTVYTCAYLGYELASIYGQGTIYLRFKTTGATDCIFATNDLNPGYESDVAGDVLSDDTFQQAANYSAMGSMVRLGGGDQPFRGRDGANGYLDAAGVTMQSDTWYELWSQIDCANFQTRWYLCEDGGTPTVVPNPLGGEWWGWRNQSRTNYSVMNLKFFMGIGAAVEYSVFVDTIAVDIEGYTTDRLADADPVTPCLGDANGDKTVDIQDFVILKQNYGIATGATFAMGDFNGDGAVDIQDFVILKQNYGTTCE